MAEMNLAGRTLTIERESGGFVVDDKTLPGAPSVGRGHTMHAAIGAWFVAHQEELGFKFHVDNSALASEKRRRQRELAKR